MILVHLKMLRFLLVVGFFCCAGGSFAQLGFCSGSKGDPIFQEDFGTASGYGPPLAAGLTNYTYISQDPQDGQYAVSDIIGRQITSWHSYLPNSTPSNGRALIVNASFTSGQFYSTAVSGLCENTTYEFSAFLINVYNPTSNACPTGEIPINVRFEIWDETDTQLLKEGSTGSIPGTATPRWKQYALTFKSEANQEKVILKIYNNGEGGCGNDLAIDDIIFRSCGDLTTISSEETEENYIAFCQAETPVQISLTATPDFSVYSTHAYQWQQSINGENWSNIAGANSADFISPNILSSTFFRVKVAEDDTNLNNNLCSSATQKFEVKIIPVPYPPVSNGDVVMCNEDIYYPVAVTAAENTSVNWYDAAVGGNLLEENSVSYRATEEGIYYAESISTIKNCGASSRTAVSFTIIDLPVVTDQFLQLCPGQSLILDTQLTGYQFQWNTGETGAQISVDNPGDYSVLISSAAGCSITQNFVVSPVDNAEISEVIIDENQITIVSANPGTFQYSLDGTNFQDENIFKNLSGGIYTAYIRDLAGCKTVTREFAYILPEKVITPNGDGYHDYFSLKGVEYFENSTIRIFDRYGKLLKSAEGRNFRWDGTYVDKELPADDYWYDIEIEGFGILKGHFTLLR